MCIWYIQYQNFNLIYIYIYVSTLYIYIYQIHINSISYCIITIYLLINRFSRRLDHLQRSSHCGRRRNRTKRRERRSRCLRGSASCWMVSVVVENDSIRCVAERWKLGGCCIGWLSFGVFCWNMVGTFDGSFCFFEFSTIYPYLSGGWRDLLGARV